MKGLAIAVLLVGCQPAHHDSPDPLPPAYAELRERAWECFGATGPLPTLAFVTDGLVCGEGYGWMQGSTCAAGRYWTDFHHIDVGVPPAALERPDVPVSRHMIHEMGHASLGIRGIWDPTHEEPIWRPGGDVDRCRALLIR